MFESFVLGWHESQIGIRSNQFGGMKGAGTEHFLLETWQEILEDLDDPRAATLLTSIDYSKAFNRLNFDHCLTCLREKGASAEILSIVCLFLTDRTLSVKLGNARSTQRPVLGGVPQGSKLGVILFNNSIDNFEANSPDIQAYPLIGGAATNHVPPPLTLREPTDVAVPPAVPCPDTNLRPWRP